MAMGAERVVAIVPCAGAGRRSGLAMPKQYALLAGQPVIAHTLQLLSSIAAIDCVFVALAPGDDQFDGAVPSFVGHALHCGGPERHDTVRNALTALLERGDLREQDWALVHDAARCLTPPRCIEQLIAACRPDDVGGLLALPVDDTLKAGAQGRSTGTVPRSDKWLAQTPQMFRARPLLAALRQAGANMSDEAAAMEAAGHQPLLVRGDWCNIKLTWPDQFAWAERWLRANLRPAAMS